MKIDCVWLIEVSWSLIVNMSTTKDKQHHNGIVRDTSLDRWEKDHVLLKGLQGDFDRLLEDDASADLHFLIDEERVLAHRLVVVARCERYRKKKRMNRPLSAENTPLIVQLGRHFSAAAVSDIVRYLYVGEVSHQDGLCICCYPHMCVHYLGCNSVVCFTGCS